MIPSNDIDNLHSSLNQSTYAITFNIDQGQLPISYEEAINNIRNTLFPQQFKEITDKFYICTAETNQLVCLYLAVQNLSKLSWLQTSLITIKAFKIEDISDFTNIIKGN